MGQVGRRQFLGSAAALLAVPLVARSQSPRRVGGVYLIDAQSGAPLGHIFQDSLRKLGWVEGQNVRFENRYAEGRIDRLKDFVAELAQLPVDVIVTGSNIETGAARQVTATIPIVMLIGADPVGAGFAASLARPGGNVTGVSFDPTPEIFGKHLELLKELAPTSVRVTVIRNPSLPGGAAYWDATNIAAKRLGLTLRSLTVESVADVKPALSALSPERGGAVFIFGDPVTYGASRQIAEASLKSRLPVIGTLGEYAVAGGLASYGVNFPGLARRAAWYVDKILRGAKPGDLPIEQPTKFEMILNLKTAKALGIDIPQSVLIRADQVIK
jgi:putative ABC transport system substrate-binding protein